MALSQHANSVLLLCLISSLTVLTYAAPDVSSKLTSATTSTCNEFSPPDPLITQRAALDHALFARSIATCGYVSGNAAYPLTCPSGYDCVSTMQEMFAWACCNQIQCVGNYRTCADFGAGLCEGNLLGATECSAIYTSILSCSDTAAPSCFRYARSTGLGDLVPRYSWGCGASGSTVLVLATTTGANGEVAASTSTNYFPTGAVATNTDTLFGAAASSSTPTSGSSSSGGGGSSSSGGNSGLDTGSIIGIIIAAVGTLGTLVGAYYAWKAVQRKRDRETRAMTHDGSGQYSGLRPQFGAPQVYAAPAPRPVYGPAPSYGGQMYPNGWR